MGNITEVKVSSLLFDPDNPRHDPLVNEGDIIAHIVKREKVSTLTESISANGLNQMELMGVVKHPNARGKYTVHEGNRRLCALRLLDDPLKAPDAKTRAAFEALKAKGQKAPDKISVVVYESWDEIAPFLGMMHNGENEGIGRRSWGAAGKNRFAGLTGSKDPNALSVAIRAYVENRGLVDAEKLTKVKITTIKRFVDKQSVRDGLGIVDKGELKLDVTQNAFDKGVTELIEHIAADPTAASRANKAEIDGWVLDRISDGTFPKAHTTAIHTPQPVATKKPRSQRHPDNRKTLMPQRFTIKLKTDNNNLLRLAYEMKDIRESHPYSAAYLLRAFVESIVKHFLRTHDKNTQQSLKSLIREAEKLLQDLYGINERHTKTLRVIASNDDHPIAPDTLGHIIHGGGAPVFKDYVKHWDTLEPSLTLLIEHAK